MMLTGWRYRATGILGAAILTIAAVWMANHPFSQHVFTSYVPLFWRLEPTVLSGSSLQLAILVSVSFVLITLIPLFKPRPWRMLDVIVTTQKQIGIAGLGLATLGFFKWSHRLPRATLVMVVGLLSVALPAWFLWIRVQPAGTSERAIVVGDDMAQLDWILEAADVPIVGYLCPPTMFNRDGTDSVGRDGTESDKTPVVADGGAQSLVPGHGIDHLGGLSKLKKVLVQYDIDTVILAYRTADRGEFFGTLDTCYEHGVTAKVHRQYADDVLTGVDQIGDLIDVDLEPWDPQDYLFKRLFDIAFAGFGLLVLSPLMILIAIAVKLDSDGPVLYGQARTAGFGETFPVYKFRTMLPESESTDPIEDAANDRITRVGRVLRTTHLDEIPQLWSIFVGDMTVVGPRAAWVEEERVLEENTDSWRKRWFVKPGLTGLAQINDAKSTDPDEKLRYDLRYIREQSFWFDLKIVIRQLWKVVVDVRQAFR